MTQSSDHRVLALGVLTCATGISLAIMLYQTRKSRRRASWPKLHLSSNDERGVGGLVVVDGSVLQGGQAEVLERLGALMQSVSELKDEVRALKEALPMLQDHVRDELRGRGGQVATVRRASPLHRATPSRRRRVAGAAARAEGQSSEEAESEGGYMTALTDSEEGEQSEGDQSGEEQVPVDELSVLLGRVDVLHKGTEADKRESLATLLEKKEEFGRNSQFLWRFVRAYSDLHDISSNTEDKKAHAETGRKVGEEAVTLDPTSAEIHQWYAIMCGIMAEYETVQNRIKNGYIFKEHLDKAIELKPLDPMSYYLLGRWCYAVAQLSWIERKVAATLFGEPPSATVQDALEYFLKVEELSPKYSKLNYVFLAKCYKDLGQKGQAKKMCEDACLMDTVSKEDEEAQKELDLLHPSLG
ncbi:regulator of microtubule dynamics protein 2 isoform X2 [Osmerus mordax]|uniref:regulator of microtubule dynamics protein 2 isoform X2 n=1 Tax=Osmerus mordax TaxID=8014 RepID=UPI00350E9598